MAEKILYKHKVDVHNTKASDIILPVVFNYIDVKSIVDVGCGIGTWLKSAEQLGVRDFIGVDGNYVNKQQLVINHSNFIPADLSTPLLLDRKFDLAISLEVAEHLPTDSSDIFIESLINLSDTILFSAATIGQGGQNHLNEQPITFWKLKFEKMGFNFYDIIRPHIWNNNLVDFWYRQNIFLASRFIIDKTKFELPAVIDIIHPELYLYRVSQLEQLKKQLVLKSDEYDTYNPIIDKQLRRILKILKILKIRKT